MKPLNLAMAFPCIGAVIFASGCAVANLPPAPRLATNFDTERTARATYVVTSTADSGKGSLRDTIAAAKANAIITFKFRTKKRATITLSSGAIELKRSLSISGTDPLLLTVAVRGSARIFTIDAKTSVTIAGVTFSNGSSTQGGAILNAGTLKLTNDVFAGNQATGATAPQTPHVVWPHAGQRDRKHRSRPERHAAAPLIPQPAITGNGFGGAIYNAASLTITSSTFFKNSAGFGSGGAIYNAASATLTVSGSVFSLNQGALGGAINNAGTAIVGNDSFKNNTGSLVGEFGYGGAIYIAGDTTIANSTFAANSVGGAGSASYGAGGAIAQYAGAATVSGSTFSANLAGGGQSGSWGTGGAIYTTAGSTALAADTFSANRAGGDASGYGGAVYADHAFSGSKNVFTQNVAYATGAGSGAYGGAIYAGAGLTLNGDSFSANSAAGGGSAKPGVASGGAIDSEATATLTSLKVTSNVASGGLGGAAQGGAIYLGGGSSTWTSLTASGNSASATGAGSFAAGGAVVTLARLSVGGLSSISSNTASTSTTSATGGIGGAFAVEVGPFSFTGSVSGNSATTEGGGFWIGDSALIANSLVSGNRVAAVQAPNDGGAGMYVALGGALTLKGSTLSANSTHGSVALTGGGGLFNSGSVTITNDTIVGNSSSEDGGGIENDATAGFSATNATIYQNSAVGEGGNVKNLDPDSVMSVANTIIAGGTGGGGADDVSNDGKIASGDYNLVQASITGNALSGTTTHNLLGMSPQLSALASNGGPTPTNADAATSPGTSYIPYSVCSAAGITVDQRQDPRNPTGSGHCDIGAYENQHP